MELFGSSQQVGSILGESIPNSDKSAGKLAPEIHIVSNSATDTIGGITQDTIGGHNSFGSVKVIVVTQESELPNGSVMKTVISCGHLKSAHVKHLTTSVVSGEKL